MKSTAAAIFMVRPKHFGFNDQTASTNFFQNKTNLEDVATKAQLEFNTAVEGLREKGTEVFIFEDIDHVVNPDAIFPNNWISINNNMIILYPMFSANRRSERRTDIVDFFKHQNSNLQLIDLTHYENEKKFCEGTGSIVFDHQNKVAYACLSPRTSEEVVAHLCKLLNYEPACFTALDSAGNEVYHTNVMMCIGDSFAIICSDSIIDADRKNIITKLESTGRSIIEITLNQMNCFAGNMLQLQNKIGQKFLVMSETSYKSLSLAQLKMLEVHVQLLVFNVQTIEFSGGGSIRCMMAEVFS